MTHYLYTPATPNFGLSQVPDVDVINSSSAVVKWPKANDIPSGLEFYYYYVVWLQVAGQTERKVARIPQGADVDQLESNISGLASNTRYSVRVEPCRQLSWKQEGGRTTDVTPFKTRCVGTVTFYLFPFDYLLFVINNITHRNAPRTD